MYTFVYFDFLINMDSNECFLQEDVRKINEKRGYLFRRVCPYIGQNSGTFQGASD